MAYDKLIDSAKLDAAMNATADAIRGKTGGSADIPWNESTGFASAISAIKGKLHSKTVTPGASSQTVKPDSGYDGLSQITVNGDANLVAANIAAGVSIFGVAGTFGSGSKVATGSFEFATEENLYSTPYTISGLAFQPSKIIIFADPSDTWGDTLPTDDYDYTLIGYISYALRQEDWTWMIRLLENYGEGEDPDTGETYEYTEAAVEKRVYYHRIPQNESYGIGLMITPTADGFTLQMSTIGLMGFAPGVTYQYIAIG